MTVAYGGLAHLGYGREATWGTADTVDVFTRVVSLNPADGRPTFLPRYRRYSPPTKLYFGQHRATLETVIEELYSGNTLMFWDSLFGGYQYQADTPGVGANTHTFSLNSDPAQSEFGMTMEPFLGLDSSGAFTFRLLGMQCMGARIEISEDQPLAITWRFSGAQEDPTPVTPTATSFLSDEFILPTHIATLNIDGNPIAIRSGFIEISRARDTERIHYGRTTVGQPVINGPMEVQFEFTMDWEKGTGNTDSFELYQNFKSTTQNTGLIMKFTSDTDIPTTSTKYDWQLVCATVQVEGDTPAVQDDEVVEATIRGRALGASPAVVTVVTGASEAV